MNIYEKLTKLQNELKAPKNQYNNFGKYKYRNCEDILEAVKPLLLENKLAQIINDEVIVIQDRFYIKATVTLYNSEKTEEVITVSALAREEQSKKGMEGSQLTGATSSYARKYALAGLYALDDTKDSDSMNNKQEQGNKQQQGNQQQRQQGITQVQIKFLQDKAQNEPNVFRQVMTQYKVTDVNKLTFQQAQTVIGKITELIGN